MKKNFEMPEIEVIKFATEDIMDVSGEVDPGEGGLPVLP